MINYTEKGYLLHEALAAAGYTLYEHEGVWITPDDPVAVQEFIDSFVPTFNDLLAPINKRCDELLHQLRSEYPESEVFSWDKQEAEARAGGGPLTDALALARGVPANILREKIVLKADAYAAACGRIIGIRQRLEDRLRAGELNVEWPEDDA